MKTALRRALSVAALAVAPLAAVMPVASAAPVTVHYACQGDTPLGPQNFTLDQDTEVTAPATVAPGGAVSIVVDPGANTVPGDVNGFTVKQVSGLALKVPIPANSTYVSSTLSGGSNVGTTAVTVADSVATITMSGPIAGGAAFEVPTVTVELTAGASGTIDTSLYGSSYSDAGLTFTAKVGSILGDITVPTSCYPDPNPVLSTTTIG